MVVTGRFQSYFYVLQGFCHRLDLTEKVVEAGECVGDGEGVKENFTVRVRDETVVFVLGDIHSNNDQTDHLLEKIDAAGSTGAHCFCNLVLHKPSCGI